MASRDGVHFDRWNEAFLRPGPQRPDTWNYGHQFIAWHAVETKSDLPGAASEISLYASEGAWTGSSNAMRRYTLRLDGFVSVNAPWKGGELITRTLKFDGRKLAINFATSAAGSVQVEIQHPNGTVVPGFGLNDCRELFGDSVDRTVTWQGGPDVSKLSGNALRLRFVLKDADLYSFQVTE